MYTIIRLYRKQQLTLSSLMAPMKPFGLPAAAAAAPAPTSTALGDSCKSTTPPPPAAAAALPATAAAAALPATAAAAGGTTPVGSPSSCPWLELRPFGGS